ncbi:MAG: M1 family metallopeptidase [Bacteroidetes bacterium]|nr:M1 family metallopeptidase [Bacteroidota bacterium]
MSLFAQTNPEPVYTRQDTLRGSNGAYRQHWDVLKYDITVKPDFNSKTIEGKNSMTFFDNGVKLMQVDLQEPMILDSVSDEQHALSFSREGNVYWVMIRDTAAMYKIKPGLKTINLYFHGKPREAVRPPWDGGWIWKKDAMGNPWMSVACQGLGASVWYPCKDIQSDEPDSGAILRIIVPDSLTAVGNGRLKEKKSFNDGCTQYSWEVKSPINNYCIVPYIGKYVHFGEIYNGEKGKLDMDYWVLDYNLEKAKKQFEDAPRMMKAFEYWFGPYPFYADGYKLVESPHLGMEHQSAIAYGNGYRNGYMGKDLSGSGWGMKWDFIIVHESGHEWFANNITSKDIADMWIHESFTNYSETLFTDYYYGKEAGNDYVIGTRKKIANDIPIIGPYAVNKEGSGDMYYKGGNMIHIIRQLINDDQKFREMLHGLNKTFYHQTVTSKQIEDYISKFAKKDFSKIFDQYLRTINIPVLEYKITGHTVSYRWTNVVSGFNMPVKISFGKKDSTETMIKPTTAWQKTTPGNWYNGETFIPNRNFYIQTKKVQ